MSEMWQWVTTNWQFVVGTAVGVLGVIIAVATIIWQRKPKLLDYEVMDEIRIAIPEALTNPVTVQWADHLMQDPHVTVVRVTNTGKKAISSRDFEGGTPIIVQFEPNDDYWDAGVVATSKGLDPNSIERVADDRYQDQLALIPKLMNPEDYFDLQILTDKPHESIRISSRFADQSRDMRRVPLDKTRFSKSAMRRLFALYVLIILVTASATGVMVDGLYGALANTLTAGFSIIMLITFYLTIEIRTRR